MIFGLSAILSFNAIVLAEGGISQATRFDRAASPGYIDGDDYVGGFDVDQQFQAPENMSAAVAGRV